MKLNTNVGWIGQTSQGRKAARSDKICSVYSHTLKYFMWNLKTLAKTFPTSEDSVVMDGTGAACMGKAALTKNWPGWPLLMQWHIPAITKLKEAWDNYSRQHGEDRGHRLVEFWGICHAPRVANLIPSKPSLDINSSRYHTEGFWSGKMEKRTLENNSGMDTKRPF